MKCKLFDLAAFGPADRVTFDRDAILGAVSYGPKVSAARARLRRSVLLDASEFYSTWEDWLLRPGTYSDELRQCIPPWPETFVYGGVDVFRPEDNCTGEPFKKNLRFYTGYQVREFEGLHSPTQEHCQAPHSPLVASETYRLLSLRSWCAAAQPGGPVISAMEIIAYLDTSGRFLTAVLPRWFTNLHKNSPLDPSQENTYTFPLFAFQLMHCRNVTTSEPQTHMPVIPKGRRRGLPKITFHTLSISDSLVKREGENAAEGGLGKSKHVCRGNFAHYTEEKKLFGKYVGTFWRPLHVKGSSKHGIVGKDYKLN